jgi:hypothetical protein
MRLKRGEKQRGRGLKSLKYATQVLMGPLKEFIKEMDEEQEHSMLIVEDGAPGHTSKLVKQAQSELGIKKLLLPTKSPDLNLIEPLWYVFKTCIVDICGSGNSFDNMWEASKKVWDEFMLEEIKKYTATMDGCLCRP